MVDLFISCMLCYKHDQVSLIIAVLKTYGIRSVTDDRSDVAILYNRTLNLTNLWITG